MAQTIRPIPIHRLEAFSDGVIAIVITLMILEIKIPDLPDNASSQEIWKAWYHLLPNLSAYVMSFVMLGVLWVNHHQFFHQLKNIDRKILWYNLFLLFWMCIIPIPTAFLGFHFERPEATVFYGFTMFMTTIGFAILREYVYKHQELLIDNLSISRQKILRKKLLLTVGLYFISIFAGYISTFIPIGIFILVIIMYFMPQKIVVETIETPGSPL